MSADNWTICPKCKLNREKEIKVLRGKVASTYGKVTQDEFLSQMGDIASKENEEQEKTLREDYSMGMDEGGSLAIDYRAYCNNCQFKHSYNYIIAIDIGGKK